jgi:hypothetical protein
VSAARRPDDFTPGGYRELLERALAAGYRVACFRDFAPPGDGPPVLLLRHDLDHSLRAALVLARIEAELGVRATYFVQVACPFYNLLAPEGRAFVRELADLGHEVGLHYDGGRYAGPEGVDEARADRDLVARLAGAPVVSASRHIPIDSLDFDVSALVRNEAYAPRFTAPPMTYVSDSLLVWRQWHPLELVERGRSLQLLTHPFKWAQATRDVEHAMRRAFHEECRALRRAYREASARYARLLRDRERLDAAFAASRAPAAAEAP